MEIYPSRNINLPFLKVKKSKPTNNRSYDFFGYSFVSLILQAKETNPARVKKNNFFLSHKLNNLSLSQDISKNFRSNFSNKLQVNNNVAKPLIGTLRSNNPNATRKSRKKESLVLKIFHSFAALTREIFFNTRREISYLRAAM